MAKELNRIVLQGFHGRHEEARAGSVIAPGEIIELATDGDLDPQPAAVGEAIKGGLKIATEDGLQGKTIDNIYAIGDLVFYYIPLPGDIINVLVKAGQTIVLADNLVVEGGGSGLAIKAAGTEARYQLQSLEDSGGALAANTVLQARVL